MKSNLYILATVLVIGACTMPRQNNLAWEPRSFRTVDIRKVQTHYKSESNAPHTLLDGTEPPRGVPTQAIIAHPLSTHPAAVAWLGAD